MNLRPEGFERKADVFEILFQAKEKGKVIPAEIGGIDYPNDIPTWILRFPQLDSDITGLVPLAETNLDKNLMNRFVGQPINVKILGLDREHGLVVCSRKAAVEEAQDKINLKEGDIVSCSVRAIVPNHPGKPSLWVDIGGGILAEIPNVQAKVKLTQALNKQYHIGQTISAKVVIAGFGDQLQLSVRDARPDPWAKANYKRGQTVSGTVAHIHDQNMFVEPDLTPGLLGLASYPTIGALRPGQRISCVVANFSSQDRKLRLRFRGRI